jgi:hypothetical protein
MNVRNMARSARSRKTAFFRSWLFWVLLILVPLILWVFYQQTVLQARAALPETYSPKVLLLIYNPTISGTQKLVENRGWNDPQSLTQQVINTIALASSGKVNYSIVETVELDAIPVKADGWQYTVPLYLACLNNAGGPTTRI